MERLWCIADANPAVPNQMIDEDHQTGLGLSRFRAAPGARLGHFPFESDGAFPAQC